MAKSGAMLSRPQSCDWALRLGCGRWIGRTRRSQPRCSGTAEVRGNSRRKNRLRGVGRRPTRLRTGPVGRTEVRPYVQLFARSRSAANGHAFRSGHTGSADRTRGRWSGRGGSGRAQPAGASATIARRAPSQRPPAPMPRARLASSSFLAVAEPQRDSDQAGIGGDHGMVAREEQHPLAGRGGQIREQTRGPVLASGSGSSKLVVETRVAAKHGSPGQTARSRSSRYGPASRTASSSFTRGTSAIESGVSAGIRRSAPIARSRRAGVECTLSTSHT